MANFKEKLDQLRAQQAAKSGGATQAPAPPPKPTSAPPRQQSAPQEQTTRPARPKKVDFDTAYGGMGAAEVYTDGGNKNWERCGTYLQRVERVTTGINGNGLVYFEIEKTVLKVLAVDPMSATGLENLRPHPVGDVCFHRTVKRNHYFLKDIKRILLFFGGGIGDEGNMTKNAIDDAWKEACKLVTSDAQPLKGKVVQMWNHVKMPREAKEEDGETQPPVDEKTGKPKTAFTRVNYKRVLTLEDVAAEIPEADMERFWPGGHGLELIDG